MLELNAQHIHMHQVAADKPAALALLGEVLVADGLVAPGYLDGLRAREAQGSTFLGQGIAIPHGTPQTRDQVLRTGVSLIQFPNGVDWGDGQQVYLAIAIAAEVVATTSMKAISGFSKPLPLERFREMLKNAASAD